jgi:hypothetical protein
MLTKRSKLILGAVVVSLGIVSLCTSWARKPNAGETRKSFMMHLIDNKKGLIDALKKAGYDKSNPNEFAGEVQELQSLQNHVSSDGDKGCPALNTCPTPKPNATPISRKKNPCTDGCWTKFRSCTAGSTLCNTALSSCLGACPPG